MRHIEEKARMLLEQSGQTKAPINPQKVAEWLGIEVKKLPFEDDLSGVLIREEGHCVIGINQNHHPNRQRFTIAHEIGHQALNHHGEVFVDQAILNKRDRRSSIAVDPQEIEANNFAAALLMPRDFVVQELKSRLDKAPKIQRSNLLDEMASRFKVSPQAMEFRLVNLGLISASW